MSRIVIGWLWGLMIKGECWGMRRIFFPCKEGSQVEQGGPRLPHLPLAFSVPVFGNMYVS